ncbi:MAG: hypothetical protein K6F84_06600 [Lachnospiraceae bacterium]|nr:hypothetical protein [Lachnospiraceae bacterium]
MRKKCIGILLAATLAVTGLYCPSTQVKAATQTSVAGCYDWALGASYKSGDLVKYQGKLYLCKSDITIQYSDWTPVNPASTWAWAEAPVVKWAFGITINDGDVVEYNGKIYRCNVGYTVSIYDWHPENEGLAWRYTPLGALSGSGESSYPEWAYLGNYKVGDIVKYNGATYKCIKAHTAEWQDWTPTQCAAKYWECLDSSKFGWSSITPLATASNQNANSLKLASDADNLYVRVDGNNLGTKGQLFIDSDNNKNTGYLDYKFPNAGMDYMIEGSTMYYHQSNDNSWSWSVQNNTGMTTEKQSSCIEYTVPRSILGSSVAVVFKDVDSSYTINGTLPAEGNYVYYSPGSGNNNGSTNTNLTSRTFYADDSHVKATGRSVFYNNERWLTFSASKIEFKFHGTAASIDIRGDKNATNSDTSCVNARCRIAIEIDGTREEYTIDKDYQTIEVLKDIGQQPADHVVSVIKLTEMYKSSCAVSKIRVKSDEDIKLTPNKQYYFEFMGDSITCGWGSVGMMDSTLCEDASCTYAAVCSKELGADFSCVSGSGYGLYSAYTDKNHGGQRRDKDLIPSYYDKVGNPIAGFESVPLSYERTRKFDVCVINLGTNDNSYIYYDNKKYTETRREEYVDAYFKFIKEIREKNPNAKIVCTIGLMWVDEDLIKTIKEEVVDKYNANNNEKIYFFRLPSTSSYGYGQGNHPNQKGHEVAGKALAEFIANNVL